MHIGDRYREIRERKKITQGQAATRVGWKRQQINRLENSSGVSTNQLQTALRGIETSFAEFFYSKIPEQYSDPVHQEIHENLQTILESETEYSPGIKLIIETYYNTVVRNTKKAKKDKKAVVSNGGRGTNKSQSSIKQRASL
jgi:transcriptional regulator with XRE-family HTH domain